MERAVIALQHVREDRVGRVEEDRHAELGAARIERLEPLGVDARIAADAAGHVHAHQAVMLDRAVERGDRDLGIDQGHDRARPDAIGMEPLDARHLRIPGFCRVEAFVRRQVRIMEREGTGRADHVDPVAQPVHVGELRVEFEPFRTEHEPGFAFLAPVIVAAARIPLGPRIALALAQLLEHRARPPVEMRIDDMHQRSPAYACIPWRGFDQRSGFRRAETGRFYQVGQSFL